MTPGFGGGGGGGGGGGMWQKIFGSNLASARANIFTILGNSGKGSYG